MSEFKLIVSFDTSDPYQKEIVDKIRSFGKNKRVCREFIMSAFLYYIRSPSYMMTVAMEDFQRNFKDQTQSWKSWVDNFQSTFQEDCLKVAEQLATINTERTVSDSRVLVERSTVEDVVEKSTSPDGLGDIFKGLAGQFGGK